MAVSADERRHSHEQITSVATLQVIARKRTSETSTGRVQRIGGDVCSAACHRRHPRQQGRCKFTRHITRIRFNHLSACCHQPSPREPCKSPGPQLSAPRFDPPPPCNPASRFFEAMKDLTFIILRFLVLPWSILGWCGGWPFSPILLFIVSLPDTFHQSHVPFRPSVLLGRMIRCRCRQGIYAA
jgi:hypothetical protein